MRDLGVLKTSIYAVQQDWKPDFFVEDVYISLTIAEASLVQTGSVCMR